MKGAYPWGLIKHGELSCCLNSEGKEILQRLPGIFSALCTCHHTLVFTWWLLTDCRQSCLEKWSASKMPTNWVCTNGKCVRITRQSFKPRVSGATSRVILTHVSLPGAAWCPNSKEWSTNTTDSEPSRCLLNMGIPGPQPRPMESESWAVGPWNPTVFKKFLADCGKSIWGSRM